jgi:hypothetical protein
MLHLTSRWRAAVFNLTGRCAYCITDPATCPHTVAASQKKHAVRDALQAMASAGESALLSAATKFAFDDTPWPIREDASPPSDNQISKAFAVMLDLADRIDEAARLTYCDAPTRTGRAFQAALFAALAHPIMLRIPAFQKDAAYTVIEAISKFIVRKHSGRPQTNEREMIRWTFGSLLLFGRISTHDLAEKLGVDRSTLDKRRRTDWDAIEWEFARFLGKNVPQTAPPMCYIEDEEDDNETSSVRADYKSAFYPDNLDNLSRYDRDLIHRLLFD